MHGQWSGNSEGDTVGHLILDLDDCYDHFQGTARLFAAGEPGIVCGIRTIDRAVTQKLEGVPLLWMPEGQPQIVTRDVISGLVPGSNFPATAEVILDRVSDNELIAKWVSDIGTAGQATLTRSRAEKPSVLQPLSEVKTWSQFKEFAVSQEPGKFIFRGQPEAFRLRTAFHRTHRKDLVRFVAEDIPLAYKLLTGQIRHLFDLAKPDQVGAFYNLLQHHGYPTPLLDWTYSPFVAAFFAYRRRPREAPTDKIRIFAFDKDSWERDFSQLQAVNFAEHHFSILDALAIENLRAIPQQALSTLTNVDDVETYIAARETEREKKYLYAVDLPADLRREVMVELSFMGITAGTLFPGLDGACEALKGRLFHQQLTR